MMKVGPARPSAEADEARPSTKGLDHLAWLMDRAIRIPGTNITVGLDAILGLLPVGGDFVTGLVQAGIVLVALHRYRVPKPIAARMAANVLIDVAIGAIPVLGDAFDVFFKANTRNLKLLHEVKSQREKELPVSTRSSILYLVGIALVLITALVLVLIGAITVLGWLLRRPLI